VHFSAILKNSFAVCNGYRRTANTLVCCVSRSTTHDKGPPASPSVHNQKNPTTYLTRSLSRHLHSLPLPTAAATLSLPCAPRSRRPRAYLLSRLPPSLTLLVMEDHGGCFAWWRVEPWMDPPGCRRPLPPADSLNRLPPFLHSIALPTAARRGVGLSSWIWWRQSELQGSALPTTAVGHAPSSSGGRGFSREKAQDPSPTVRRGECARSFPDDEAPPLPWPAPPPPSPTGSRAEEGSGFSGHPSTLLHQPCTSQIRWAPLLSLLSWRGRTTP
jgi:hypothetical protein